MLSVLKSTLGNAEVERAQQAARQAELLASEAKKGEVEEKHKTSESLAKFPSVQWNFPSITLGMVGHARWDCQLGLKPMCVPGTRRRGGRFQIPKNISREPPAQANNSHTDLRHDCGQRNKCQEIHKANLIL